jgi:hypothetical protein
MAHPAVFARLVQVAKARKTISYSDLGTVADVSLDSDDDLTTLGHILDEIADQERAAGRPLLPCLVVSGKTGMPGGGLFKYAVRKGLQPKKMDNVTFWATELNRVYDYWAMAGVPVL